MRRAVFLDRDGVIIRAVVREGRPYPPDSLEQVEVLTGVPNALEKLHTAGFLLIVVTNQPDVARNTQTREEVEAINNALLDRLRLDEIRVCYHDDRAACNCRKPKPGLLTDSAQEHGIDLTGSFMVGDRWRDIEAGLQAGCTTIFIDYHYEESLKSQPHVVVNSLEQAADWILSRGYTHEAN
jgi:D-glycero-D-manno-heptose 1,7-bisphosphate phosphatase